MVQFEDVSYRECNRIETIPLVRPEYVPPIPRSGTDAVMRLRWVRCTKSSEIKDNSDP